MDIHQLSTLAAIAPSLVADVVMSLPRDRGVATCDGSVIALRNGTRTLVIMQDDDEIETTGHDHPTQGAADTCWSGLVEMVAEYNAAHQTAAPVTVPATVPADWTTA